MLIKGPEPSSANQRGGSILFSVLKAGGAVPPAGAGPGGARRAHGAAVPGRGAAAAPGAAPPLAGAAAARRAQPMGARLPWGLSY